MSSNASYKDSVFSFLFSNADVLRELYCALEGVTLPVDIPVTINTLQDVLFKGLINDVSFEIDGKLIILVEHQSTINPNMALRLLMYIARIYEKIVGSRNIYGTKRLSIPRPEFFVLYNGAAPYPAENRLKLSEMFENAESLGIAEQEFPALELSVKVLNINQGMNEGIVRKSKTLAEYSAFVGKVREFEREGKDREEAIKEAIRYCCNEDILKEFLEQHAAEVMSMLLTEWNWDDALAVRFEEGIEQGMIQGIEQGMIQGIEQGREEGIEQGMEKTARNALEEGLPIDIIQKITGLDTDIIRHIQAELGKR